MEGEIDVATERSALHPHDSRSGGVDSRFCCNICLDAVEDPVASLCGHLYCWPCLFRWLEPGMYPQERASLGLVQPYLAIDSNRRKCPVCKAPCSVPNLVPIYVRDSADSSTTRENDATATGIEPLSSSDMNLEGSAVTNVEVQSEVEFGFENSSSTGLRQRHRSRSREDPSSGDTIPSRPQAMPAQHVISASSSSSSPASPAVSPDTQQYGRNSWVSPLSPGGHRGSLTHGLLLSLQQATAGSQGVPPLHRRGAAGHEASDLDAHPGATEYLSRLVIMLASFVILCLLLM